VAIFSLASALDQVLAVVELAGDGSLQGTSVESLSDFGEMDLDDDLCTFLAEQFVSTEAGEERDEQVKRAGASFSAQKSTIAKKLGGKLKARSKFRA
jgi:hypothetical protein